MSTFSRKPSRLIITALFAVALMAAPIAISQSYDPDQDLPKETLTQKRVEKLGRGLSNILFGWTEIPLTWNDGVQKGRPLTRIITTGTLVGTTKALMRTGIGVYEMFTFYIGNSSGDYEPMLEPEYLF